MSHLLRRSRLGVGFVIAVATLACLPLLPLPGLVYSMLAIVLMYASMAESWNLVGGYAGYTSLANAAFFGIGAYTTAISLRDFGWNPFLTIFLGGVFAVLLAVGIGYPTLRLRGNYFVLVTLAITLVMSQIFLGFADFTGGGKGIYNIHAPGLTAQIEPFVCYWYYLLLLTVTVVLAYKIENSSIGLGLMAIRENEDAAAHMGVDATRLKTLSFAASAFFLALAGGIYPLYLSYIDPNIAFAVLLTVTPMLTAVLGGRGTWLGPIVGVFLFQTVTYYFSFSIASELNVFITGVAFVAVMVAMPRGILGYLKEHFRS